MYASLPYLNLEKQVYPCGMFYNFDGRKLNSAESEELDFSTSSLI